MSQAQVHSDLTLVKLAQNIYEDIVFTRSSPAVTLIFDLLT